MMQHLRKASQRQLSSRVSSLGSLTSLRVILNSLMAASNCVHTPVVKIGYVQHLARPWLQSREQGSLLAIVASDDTSEGALS